MAGQNADLAARLIYACVISASFTWTLMGTMLLIARMVNGPVLESMRPRALLVLELSNVALVLVYMPITITQFSFKLCWKQDPDALEKAGFVTHSHVVLIILCGGYAVFNIITTFAGYDILGFDRCVAYLGRRLQTIVEGSNDEWAWCYTSIAAMEIIIVLGACFYNWFEICSALWPSLGYHATASKICGEVKWEDMLLLRGLLTCYQEHENEAACTDFGRKTQNKQ